MSLIWKIIDGYNAHKPLARGYLVKYTDAWCATFVSFVIRQAISPDITPVYLQFSFPYFVTHISFNDCNCVSVYRFHKSDVFRIARTISPGRGVKTYTVKKGDSLWAIAAAQLGDGSRYNEIKTMNGLTSNTIHAGQTFAASL